MVWLFIYVLLLHFFADFVLQSRWMADNKSRNVEALTLHVFVYSLTLWVGAWIMLAFDYWDVILVSRFALLNFVVHWIIDKTTSRFTQWAWFEKKDVHLFFCIVGLDQFLHAATLLITTQYILGEPK